MAPPNKIPQYLVPGDATFQQHYSQVVNTINQLIGYENGKIELVGHIDMGGKKIMNLGTPETATDALPSGVAEGKYSASVLQPQLEAGAATPLKSYKAINSATQREKLSSFLNDLLSSPPNASTVFPTLTNVGAQVQVSIPASTFHFADGSVLQLQGRTDLLSKPSQYAISSLTVAGGIVTCNCAPSGLVAGEVATIAPTTNASFAGTFQLISSTGGGAVLQYQDAAAAGSDSSGFVQVNGIFYYSIKKGQPNLVLSGPFSADTSRNRLVVSSDGSQIVAVIAVTNSGGQVANSGGGGTPLSGPPASGSHF